MGKQEFKVRNAKPGEFEEIGKLMVGVYSQLEGFPKEAEQPGYYKMLANVGELTNKPGTELLAAVSPDNKIAGAVVYFGDMQYYGSGGSATRETNASGFRLLAVAPWARGLGIGKLLLREPLMQAGYSGGQPAPPVAVGFEACGKLSGLDHFVPAPPVPRSSGSQRL